MKQPNDELNRLLQASNPVPNDRAKGLRDSERARSLLAEITQGDAPRASRTAWFRRPAILITAVTGLVLTAGIATGSIRWPAPDDLAPGTEPQQSGEVVAIQDGTAFGSSWSLTANQSNQGLCIHIEKPNSAVGGCGFDAPDNTAVTLLTETVEEGSFFYGPVDERATRVEIELESGRVLELDTRSGPEDWDVSFFVTSHEGDDRATKVTAYDQNGEVLGTYSP